MYRIALLLDQTAHLEYPNGTNRKHLQLLLVKQIYGWLREMVTTRIERFSLGSNYFV